MNQFCCSICNNPLKIKNGDYIFTYNIECCNNHINTNVKLEDILSTKKPKSFICEKHKKKYDSLLRLQCRYMLYLLQRIP